MEQVPVGTSMIHGDATTSELQPVPETIEAPDLPSPG
jgi:hypothetical protein